MKRSKRERGITLIELLIAVSLVALLSTGILMAMRVGLNALEKTNRSVLTNRRALGAQRVLDKIVAGLMPVPLSCAGANGQIATLTDQPYFHGSVDAMRFVSSYSLDEAARGVPKIVELFSIPGEEGRGVRLVMNETPYTGPMSLARYCSVPPSPPAWRPAQASAASFVLADKLAAVRFTYERDVPVPAPPGIVRWLPLWTMQPNYPIAVRIDLEPLDGEAQKIQPVSLIAPIFVRRSLFLEYAD